MLHEIGNSLKRGWYRLNSKAVWPEQVKVGDQLLFDFPGTGPYWTSPIVQTLMTWQAWGWLSWVEESGPQLYVYLVLDNGGTLLSDLKAPIRVRR
jgi:hypothetical protein